MTKKSAAQICAVTAVLALPSLSWAGTETKAKKAKAPAVAPAPEKVLESAITGDIGLNVVTSYYYHGAIQQNHSASFQPYADINFKAFEGDGFLNKATVNFGIWNSLTNPKTSTAPSGNGAWKNPKAWVESDFTPGVSLTFGKVTLTESYQFMFFPNKSTTKTSESIVSKLAFDDSDLLGALALHPTLTHQHEISGKAALVADANQGRHGNYWEAAVAPSIAAGPVTVTAPITLAFGSSKYYKKDGYAYVSAGVNLGYALPLSKQFGVWTANLGGTYYNLNKSAVGGTADNDVVGNIGLGVAF
ncbi:MAG: hypothetical protein DVB28_002088 [Verrucomicrobia bacterium]|nr:MAG: hypothetical protein DVB28_002088 [Verrucomicrobiota bacterium]